MAARVFPDPALGADFTITMPSAGGSAISCTKNGTTTLTSSALFGSVFSGMRVEGVGIQPGTTVSNVASASSLTLSAAATDSLTSSLTFSHPAAGPRIKAIHAKFTAGAGGTSRIPKIIIDNGATPILLVGDDVAITTGIACDYNLAQGACMNTVPVAASSNRLYPMPEIQLLPGYRIRSVTAAIDPSDQWSQIVVFVD